MVNDGVILDTGPLVALFDARDRHHRWALEAWGQIKPPLLTCESVLSESWFLLRKTGIRGETIFEVLRRQAVTVPFALGEHAESVAGIMRRYANVPASLADACLVRMAELYPRFSILTFDSDFHVYRKNKREAIPVIMPSTQ